MILIVTSKRDSHVEAVSRHLDAVGSAWARLNTEDAARNIQLTVTPGNAAGTIHVKDSGKNIDLQQVRAVWYRKPEPVSLSHLRLESAAVEYVEAEFTEILLGLYGLLGHVLWINNPFTTRIAHRKMLQLQIAAKVGFSIPRSVITNSTEVAFRFARDVGSDLAIKSLGALNVTTEAGGQSVQYGIFTRRISQAELEEAKDSIVHMPTLFQEFVEKACELRVTCVGEKVFACRIEPRQGDVTADDYRFDTTNLSHSAWECPELHGSLRAYMRAFGLNFACFDIAITKTGEAVFFESNPNGQWAWVENLTGLPIGKAIADELAASEGSSLDRLV